MKLGIGQALRNPSTVVPPAPIDALQIGGQVVEIAATEVVMQ